MEHVFKELLSDTNKFLTVNDTLPNDLWLKSDIIIGENKIRVLSQYTPINYKDTVEESDIRRAFRYHLQGLYAGWNNLYHSAIITFDDYSKNATIETLLNASYSLRREDQKEVSHVYQDFPTSEALLDSMEHFIEG